MRRQILSFDVSNEKIFLFFSLFGNSIPNLVRLSGLRRTVQDEKELDGLHGSTVDERSQ